MKIPIADTADNFRLAVSRIKELDELASGEDSDGRKVILPFLLY